MQSGDSELDDKRSQGEKILENKGLGSQIEEPKPTAKNIEMPPEKDQAKFTWKVLWSRLSNVVISVTSVFKAEETDSQADSLSEQSSRNSASDPKTKEELPEESPNKSVAQRPPNKSISSKIWSVFASLWKKGAGQNKEGESTGPETSAQEGQGVYISQTPPQDLRLSILPPSSRTVSFAEGVKEFDGEWNKITTESGKKVRVWVAGQGNNQSSGNGRGRGG